MDRKPTYEELEQRVKELEKEAIERKRVEEELRTRELRFRRIIEKNPDGIVIVDGSGIVCFANPAAEAILDRKGVELIGEMFGVPSVEGETTEIKITDGEGEITTAEMRMVEVIWNGEVTHIASLRDISDRKRAEEEKRELEVQLQTAQRMESIGTLGGGIAHNFNNLLMGIQGNTSLMLYDIDSNHPHCNILKKIEKQVQSGTKLTSQLLEYARQTRYEVKSISLNQLVKETSNTFGAAKKEIRVYQALAENLFEVEADLGQIEQILLNLYVNAAEAMPGGGDLFLETLNVTDKDMTGRPYKPKPGNYVLLTVRDTSVGMDKETMQRIFEPFFTTKGLARGGTGLGLASAYVIIKAHGGYIEVHSEKGHGTTFNIYLPSSGKGIKEERELPDEFLKGKETVLLVDDEEMVADAGEQMLKKLGYEVLLAGGGREALDVYKKDQDKIDLVLLDMIMPEMGGSDTYDRIKEVNPRVKVLLSSGYSIDGQAREILDRGCNAFIQKPFNMKDLSQKIGEILDKN
jgi:signal transduction histidine kinase/CheY-like chemotaxis protein